MSPPLLSVEDLHVYYGRKIHALRGISLEVRSGEVVSLIGCNGAGKTTLLRTISGLLACEQGSIRFEGRAVERWPAHDIARLGLGHVPEGRRVFPRLTIEENLEMGAYAHGRAEKNDRDRVAALFPLLRERAGQLAGTLSGGEQQMLAIARALMGRPKLLMLDEPSMGLAPIVVDSIFETIRRVASEGVTVFLIEQNARRALGCSSRGYVLETGQIALHGASADLLESAAVRKAYLGL